LDAEGPFKDVRQRVYPGLFNDTDRAWRAKFLQSKQLTARERSMHFFHLHDNPDYLKARFNIFRRVWQAPMSAVERAIRPALGLKNAHMARWLVSAKAKFVVGVWAVTYYAYYNSGDWQNHGGWKAKYSKPATYPDNRHYPKKDPRWEMAGDDHYDHGFKAGGAGLMPSITTTHHSATPVIKGWREY